jgi:hypothetical protein
VAITYIEVDESNLSTWHQKLYDFGATLETDQRCNSSAIASGGWQFTYPSMEAIRYFAELSTTDRAMIVVAQDTGNIHGYLICTDDRSGKYGGCHCRWIGIKPNPPTASADIYKRMGDVAIAKYEWLWGRVTNNAIRTLMLNLVDGCDNSIAGQPEIVVYDPLGNKP